MIVWVEGAVRIMVAVMHMVKLVVVVAVSVSVSFPVVRWVLIVLSVTVAVEG